MNTFRKKKSDPNPDGLNVSPSDSTISHEHLEKEKKIRPGPLCRPTVRRPSNSISRANSTQLKKQTNKQKKNKHCQMITLTIKDFLLDLSVELGSCDLNPDGLNVFRLRIQRSSHERSVRNSN